MKQFIATFSPCGFSPVALAPAWGLAEATLLVTLADAGVRYYDLDSEELQNHKVRPGVANAPVTTLVGCGRVAPGPWNIDVRIVNPETREPVPPGEVGEIWVSGDLVTKGYWDRPAETAALFQNQIQGVPGKRYLRSGDLGFMDGMEVVFTGRLKDLIIVEGRNHYPQEIEKTAEKSHPALRPGCSIAFSVDLAGPTRVVLVCELSNGYYLMEQATDERTDGIPVTRGELEAAMRREVSEEHQVRLHEIVVIPTGAIPKTTSGKLQRSGCKEKYLNQTLPLNLSGVGVVPEVSVRLA